MSGLRTVYSGVVFALLILLRATVNAQSVPAMGPRSDPNGAAGQPSQVRGYIDDRIRLDTNLVSFNVRVLDHKGHPVIGLPKEAFEVLDNKNLQQLSFFSTDEGPASIAIVFDYSGSMSESKLERAKEALSRFVANTHALDEFFLIGFDARAHLLLQHTHDQRALIDKLSAVGADGQTSLFDACLLGIEVLGSSTYKKRALIVISDGEDNNSRYTFREVKHSLAEAPVTFYAVGITNGLITPGSLSASAQLEQLADASGGLAFTPSSSDDFWQVFEKIALDLRHQYSIGYTPTAFVLDGSWHKVKVKVSPQRANMRAVVHSKEGYFARYR